MTFKLSPATLKSIGQLVVILDTHPRGALLFVLICVVLGILGSGVGLITSRIPDQPISTSEKTVAVHVRPAADG